MTDFRALCAELTEALHNAIRIIHYEDGTLHISTAKPVLDRARAALSEPEPEEPTPQPVPVSERLPGPGDCDAEGRCWVWNPDPPDNDEEESWVLQPRDWIASPWTTHWLPAHALPVPGEVTQ